MTKGGLLWPNSMSRPETSWPKPGRNLRKQAKRPPESTPADLPHSLLRSAYSDTNRRSCANSKRFAQAVVMIASEKQAVPERQATRILAFAQNRAGLYESEC